jgi:hypothetical protein
VDFIRRYLVWLLVPLAALVAALVFGDGQSVISHEDSVTSARYLNDAKLRRTLRSFGNQNLPAEENPLYAINREGIGIEIELDAWKWDLMLNATTRRPFKTRANNARIRFGDRELRPAILSVRGMGSLNAVGKPNFRIELLGSEQLTPAVRVRRTYLINMRFDVEQIRMVFGYRLLRELGLFSPHFQYARVTVNGQPLGMYLLVEPPVDALRREYPDCVGVFRRRTIGTFSSEWTRSVPGSKAMINRLNALPSEEHLADPVAASASVLHLDEYLRWLSVVSMVFDTDLMDEVYFYERRTEPQKPTALHVMGWDFDDIFNPNPRPGSFDDPLLYSCSDRMDRDIQQYPQLYARYREILTEVLQQFPEDRLVAVLREVQSLRNSLDDGRPADVQLTAQAARDKRVDDVESLLRLRHAELRGRVGIQQAGLPTQEFEI